MSTPTPDATGKVLLTKEPAFESCINRKVSEDGTLRITCKRGLWGVSGGDHEHVEKEARHYWQQYFADGEYDVTPDDTGKVLLTKDQWEEAQRDKARLDWLEERLQRCSTMLSIEVIGTSDWTILRQAIDAARADTKGTQ